MLFRSVRALAKAGASAIGLEPSAEALARARQAPKARDERYVEGSGETLPFPDGSLDAVVYLNAFHHLPVAGLTPALREGARVLVPHGHLLIVEPIAEGAHFKLVRAIDDETQVRAEALRAIRSVPHSLMRLAHETYYDAPIVYADFAAFKARMTAVDPRRAAALARVEKRIAGDFVAKGRPVAAGVEFSQPTRLDLFVRA